MDRISLTAINDAMFDESEISEDGIAIRATFRGDSVEVTANTSEWTRTKCLRRAELLTPSNVARPPDH
jgi:hypothetical protein